MSLTTVVYKSAEDKTEEHASCYLKTHQAPHRYLAYRDIPKLIHKFVKGKRVLDYGAGTGASTSFLDGLGLDVIGLDVSPNMLEKARENFPHVEFHHAGELPPEANFDLVFSSFVLLELSSEEEIVRYLNSCSAFLQKEGVFIGITGSEHLYSLFREWTTFNANFPENHNLRRGDVARIALKCPQMEFYDYYWEKVDYLDCFKKTDLEVLEIYHPLGSPKDPYVWLDELHYSPFTVFLAKKTKS